MFPEESMLQRVFRLRFQRRMDKIQKDPNFMDYIKCNHCDQELIPVFLVGRDLYKTNCLICDSRS